MANKLTDMSKVRKVLPLHTKEKASYLSAGICPLSRNIVKKYIVLKKMLNLCSENIELKSDVEMEQLFSNNPPDIMSSKHQDVYDFFPYLER
jgi:hypothetical protein